MHAEVKGEVVGVGVGVGEMDIIGLGAMVGVRHILEVGVGIGEVTGWVGRGVVGVGVTGCTGGVGIGFMPSKRRRKLIRSISHARSLCMKPRGLLLFLDLWLASF